MVANSLGDLKVRGVSNDIWLRYMAIESAWLILWSYVLNEVANEQIDQ